MPRPPKTHVVVLQYVEESVEDIIFGPATEEDCTKYWNALASTLEVDDNSNIVGRYRVKPIQKLAD
jgi:hypothetical protein